MTQIQEPLENFYQKYQPGSLIDTNYQAEIEGIDASRIWTEVEEDGETLVFPGFRFVNRMGYYIAAIPRRTPDENNLVFWAKDELEP